MYEGIFTECGRKGMIKGKGCTYKCFNVKRRYAARFKDTLRQSTLVSILVTLSCYMGIDDPLAKDGDIMRNHIRPLVIMIWLRNRIASSLTLYAYPWVIMIHHYHELLPPVYPPVLSYSTIYHIMMIDGIVYKIPAYFWCDCVYFTRNCPTHKRRHTTKKFLKII